MVLVPLLGMLQVPRAQGQLEEGQCTHRAAEELVVREVEGLDSVERWSCNRGA